VAVNTPLLELSESFPILEMDIPAQEWRQPPANPWPAGGEVHVWRVDLARLGAHAAELAGVLSPDEHEKAALFRFEKDRLRFTLSRAALRTLLGLYLQSSPGSVRFTQNSFGKPFLAGQTGRGPLHFNASHSKEMALYAFSAEHEVGVDVEYVRADFASDEIARHFFSQREVEALRGVATGMKTRAFFDCWARKEAYIKARGEGLSYPLDKFAVSLEPGAPAVLLADEVATHEISEWSLADLRPAPDYAAALAVRARSMKLELLDWPPNLRRV
jgi:4'-phosphopantetheinyl transferase